MPEFDCQSGVWQGNEISTVYPGFIDYGSHVEMFGTIYDLSSLANAGVTSAYFTVINGSQFRVCVKNKDSSRSNNIAWRALAIK